MKIETLNIYEGREDVTLTGYIIDDSPELLNGKARPAILICPGGGYFNCSDGEAEPVALRFAAMGYHAFVLRYSVYGEGTRQFPDLSRPLEPKARLQYPAPVLETGRAMLLIRERAGEWLVDTDRIALCGFSAGGHNAALFAAKWHTPMITDALGGDSETYRPAALILGYPLTDYVYMDEKVKSLGPMDRAFFAGSNTAYLGTPKPDRALLEEISPPLNVTEHMPPTYIWATAADAMVPIQHSLRLAHALADQKIPFELHIFEDGPHGLSLADQASAGARSQILPDAAKWAPLAAAWLEKRFALALPRHTDLERMMMMESFPERR